MACHCGSLHMACRAGLVIGGHSPDDGGHDSGLQRREAGVVRRALDVAAGKDAAVCRHECRARRTVRVGAVALQTMRSSSVRQWMESSTISVSPSMCEPVTLQIMRGFSVCLDCGTYDAGAILLLVTTAFSSSNACHLCMVSALHARVQQRPKNGRQGRGTRVESRFAGATASAAL